MVDGTLSASVKVLGLDDLVVFLAFTDLGGFLLSFSLFEFSDKVFRELGDGVFSFALSHDGSFMRSENRQDLFASDRLDLILSSDRLGLGEILLELGGKSLLQVDNEFRFSILSLQLLNESSLVEDSEGFLQPGLEMAGDLLLSAFRRDVLSSDFKNLVVGDKSGLFQLNSAGGVSAGLDSDLGGQSDSRVLVVQFRDTGEDLGGVGVPVLLGRGPSIVLDASSCHTPEGDQGNERSHLDASAVGSDLLDGTITSSFIHGAPLLQIVCSATNFWELKKSLKLKED